MDLGDKNPVRDLQALLGLNQVEFGRLVGRSFQSIRNYVTGKSRPERGVLERMKTLAADKGWAHIALALEEWAREGQYQRFQGGISMPALAVPTLPLVTTGEREAFHSLVDRLLNSGSTEAVGAVKALLLYYLGGERVSSQASHVDQALVSQAPIGTGKLKRQAGRKS
jgi:hypothetical protein